MLYQTVDDLLTCYPFQARHNCLTAALGQDTGQCVCVYVCMFVCVIHIYVGLHSNQEWTGPGQTKIYFAYT